MFQYRITLPSSLVHYEMITLTEDNSDDYYYYQISAHDHVISWLKECTPDYKLLNEHDAKIAYFNNAADLLLFMLTFDIPSDIPLD